MLSASEDKTHRCRLPLKQFYSAVLQKYSAGSHARKVKRTVRTVPEEALDAVMWIVAYRNSDGTPAALTSGSATTDFSMFRCRECYCHIDFVIGDLNTRLEGNTSHSNSEI